MSEQTCSALYTLAYFVALAAWVPLLEATKKLLTSARRFHRIHNLEAEAFMPVVKR